jgi:hypothetical protein
LLFSIEDHHSENPQPVVGLSIMVQDLSLSDFKKCLREKTPPLAPSRWPSCQK